jgi:hypothetical protein
MPDSIRHATGHKNTRPTIRSHCVECTVENALPGAALFSHHSIRRRIIGLTGGDDTVGIAVGKAVIA